MSELPNDHIELMELARELGYATRRQMHRFVEQRGLELWRHSQRREFVSRSAAYNAMRVSQRRSGEPIANQERAA